MAHDDLQVFDERSMERISEAVTWAESHMGGPAPPPPPPRMIPYQFRRFRLITDIDPADDISSEVRAQLSSSDLEEIESGTVKGVGIAIHLRRVDGELTTGETFTLVDLIGNYTGGAATTTTDAAEGWCIHPHDRNWWEITELAQGGGASLWVELKTSLPSSGMTAALTAGQSATAHPRDWDSDTKTWVTDTDSAREFTVVDVRGVYRGRAKDDLGSPNDEGSIGRVVLNKTSDQWEIRELTPIATILGGLVDESEDDVAHTDATYNVQSLEVMQPHGGLLPATDLEEVNNTLGFPSTDGASVLVFWDEANLEWDSIPKPPLETVDPVTSIEYDTSDHEFKLKKTQNTLVFQADDEDADFDVQPAWHANVLETFTVTVGGSTAGLTRSREDFYVQEAGDTHSEGADFEYLDGTEC